MNRGPVKPRGALAGFPKGYDVRISGRCELLRRDTCNQKLLLDVALHWQREQHIVDRQLC